MIIVEGMDNTGKTTLIHKLNDVFHFTVIKSPGKADIRTHMAWVLQQLAENDPLTIYDRFSPLSEAVYGKVLRGGSVYNYLTNPLIDELLDHNPFIIYCRCPKINIVDWGDRPQMESVTTKFQELITEYDALYRTLSIKMEAKNHGKHLYIYDWTRPESFPLLIEVLSKYLLSGAGIRK